MATAAVTIVNAGDGAALRHASWAALAAGDDGTAIELPNWPDRSVQIRGTFGGTTITIQGSNEATPTTWATLTQPGGAPLSFTAAGLAQVVEITRWIRPLSTGGAGVAVTVEMIAA